MKIFLVIILGALVAVQVKKDRVPGYKAVMIGLVVLAMLASATQWRSDEDVYDESEDVSVGRVLGGIMAKELEPGCEVLVFDIGFRPGDSPRVDSRFEGLIAGWGEAGFQPVRIDPKRLVEFSEDMMSEAIYAVYEGYIEAGPFMKVVSEYPDAKAVVSFAGLPYNITQKALATLPQVYLGKRGSLSVPSDKLIELENIRAIVELRQEDTPAPDNSEIEGLPEVFTARYRLLKSAP